MEAEIEAVLAGFAEEGRDPAVAFAALIDFVRPRRGESPEVAALRFGALLGALERSEEIAAPLRSLVRKQLFERPLVRFFAESGILPATGFFTELARIAGEIVLPELPDERDLRVAVRRMFQGGDDWRWFSELPAGLSERFWAILIPRADVGHGVLRTVADQVLEAMLVLSFRVGALNVELEFGRLGPSFAGSAVHFRALATACQRYVDELRDAKGPGGGETADATGVLEGISRSLAILERVREASLQSGTSLRLTYTLQHATQSLRRLRDLVHMLEAGHAPGPGFDPGEAVRAWSHLMREAISGELRRNSLASHLSSGVSMLARRVTGNAAKSGENYIAGTRAEYAAMWRSAMGAGLFIGAMALLKIWVSRLDLALAGYALLYSLLYGLGFVAIYMLHFTVATKQPALTAQTLAGQIDDDGLDGPEDIERLVDLVAAVARTQIAAIAGNVAVALPTALALAWAYATWHGGLLVDPGKAAHLLEDLDLRGWALPHAAVAGVFLFLSGVITGWFDNYTTYARVGERIALLRWLVAVAGAPRAARVGNYVDAHLGGIMGNFLFGCMLGTAGIVGIILGLPIDIRHIAFSSANLGYALTGFQYALPWTTVLWASFGVAMIGLTNLAVSFALALWMAFRTRGVRLRQARPLFGALWRRFLQRPASFLTGKGLA